MTEFSLNAAFKLRGDRTPKICVVGSSNYDLVAYADRLPKSGETILGTDFKMGFGGKGANQAVAAAKLGAQVTMVTKLGSDIFGQQTLENYKNLGIKTDFIFTTDKAPSGVAPIWVDKNGHNSIIVIGGANDLLSVDDVNLAQSVIEEADILICQNEIPYETTKRALEIAKAAGVTTIFNPAPAPTFQLSRSFLSLVDILTPNETEAELLTNSSTKNADEARAAGRVLLQQGVKKVIMTLGAKGCVCMTDQASEYVPAYSVTACDTSGAGDCFVGSFAYFYACGFSEKESIQKAQYVASQSVQKHGTQSSFPARESLPKDLFEM